MLYLYYDILQCNREVIYMEKEIHLNLEQLQRKEYRKPELKVFITRYKKTHRIHLYIFGIIFLLLFFFDVFFEYVLSIKYPSIYAEKQFLSNRTGGLLMDFILLTLFFVVVRLIIWITSIMYFLYYGKSRKLLSQSGTYIKELVFSPVSVQLTKIYKNEEQSGILSYSQLYEFCFYKNGIFLQPFDTKEYLYIPRCLFETGEDFLQIKKWFKES